MAIDGTIRSTPPTLSQTIYLVEQLKGNLDIFLEKETEYLSQIESLEGDLRRMKRAWNSLDADHAELEQQFAYLKRAKDGLETSIKGYRVVVLLDGDGAIFSPELIQRGSNGGHDAAQLLSSTITGYLKKEFGNNPYQLWVKLFLNKRGLMDALGRTVNQATKHNFEDFLLGLNQASDRFLIVDVGNVKEAADSKIKAHLEDDLRIPQTFKVIFGGCHDNGYVSALRSHITDRFKEKLVLLQSYDELAAGMLALDLPIIPTSNIFMAEKLAAPRNISSSPVLSPARPPGLKLPYTFTDGFSPDQVPESPTSSHDSQESKSDWRTVASARHKPSSSQSSRRDPQIINRTSIGDPKSKHDSANTCAEEIHVDPKRTLAEQKLKIPPCNHHYLNATGCRHGSDCHYCHDYVGLTAEHYKELAANARKNPCPFVNDGNTCPWDLCIYGHVCPSLPKCPFQKQGICKFKGGKSPNPLSN